VLRLLGLIAFAGMAVFTLIALIGALVSLAAGRRRAAVSLARSWAGGLGLYALAMFVVSVTSRTIVLPFGVEKRFCALDCDLAFSVAGVLPAPHRVRGRPGMIVTVKVRSDAAAATMRPSQVQVWLETTEGKRFRPEDASPAAMREPLAPGAAHYVDFVFPEPPGRAPLRLVVVEGGWPSRLVIGDENSPLHRKVVMELPELLSPDLPEG